LEACKREKILQAESESVASKMKSTVLAEPNLVGRENELEELRSFLSLAAEGKGTTVLISGEAGSGKTRLTREFLDAAKKKGVTVLSGWCISDAAIPYFPFIEAFNNYFGSYDQEEQTIGVQQSGTPLGIGGATDITSSEQEVTMWLTGPRPIETPVKPQAISPQIWKDQAFAAVAKTLHTISAQQPMIMFIDDLHWADSASLALLHYVARAVKNSERILLLATFRSEELTADAEGHPHPLAETLRIMEREELYAEVRLANLNQANVSEMAQNMIGGSLQAEFSQTLAAESQGNPLFVVESLRMLHERNSLVAENNEWRLSVGELGLPSKIKGIILRRLAVLTNAQRRVLDAASVIGEKFNVDLLSTVLGQDSLEVLETLNVISRSTSLVRVEEDRYMFDHARSRETLYEELASPLKRGYHLKIAQKLEQTGKGGKLAFSEIAYNYVAAGNEGKAVEFSLVAGQDALKRFSNTEAINHFNYVIDKVPNDTTNAETRRVALEGLGDAYHASCMYVKALEVFERLASSETGATRLRAYRKAMDAVFLGKLDNKTRLAELATKAELFAASDRLESARILFLGARSGPESGQKERETRLHAFEAALQIFEEEYSIPDMAKVLIALGSFPPPSAHNYGTRISATLRSIAMFGEMGNLPELEVATYGAGASFLFHGLFIEARDLLVKAVLVGEKIGDYRIVADAQIFLSIIAETFGQVEEAISLGLKAQEYSSKTETYLLEQETYPHLARQYAKLGDLGRAQEYYDKIKGLPQEILEGMTSVRGVFRMNMVRAQAVLLAAEGNWKEADQYFVQAIEISRKIHRASQINTINDYVWALNKQGRIEEAKMRLKEIEEISEEVSQDFADFEVQADLLVPRFALASEEFGLRLDLTNVSRKPGVLVKVERLVPSEFEGTITPSYFGLQDGSVDMKKEAIPPFQVRTIKLKLKAPEADTFSLNPQVTYMDELGEVKTCKPNSKTITVQPAEPKFNVLPGRASTGYAALDALLYGGIPENYSVALMSPSTDEREQLIKRFLKTGAEAGETTFHITAEAANTKALVEEYPSNLYLIVCNPQADAMIKNAPNVFKLKGIENLTDIDIALTKAFRTIKPSATSARRICIDIVSDALLQHHAINTRRWLSALLPTLKSKGFTILAVVDPQMHPTDELQSIVGIFDGEIRVTEKETHEGIRQTLRVRKLLNQKYLENEIVLSNEKLS